MCMYTKLVMIWQPQLYLNGMHSGEEYCLPGDVNTWCFISFLFPHRQYARKLQTGQRSTLLLCGHSTR